MIPTRAILILLTVFVVFLTTFAVLLAGSSLAAAIGDMLAARVLVGFAVASLVVLLVDVVLLLLAVAIRSLEDRESRRSSDDK